MIKLKITEITPDKNQPRKYFGVEKMALLKDSIKRHGIITPLTVQKEGKGYLLIDGERRFRAASQLKLSEVPVNIIAPKDTLTRLVEQFHIQEQHESWSATEKATAVLDICNMTKKSLSDVCHMLSIDERTARYYTAFAKLQNKEVFADMNISIANAEKIHEINNFVQKQKEDVLKEPFTKAMRGQIEKILIQKIGDKEITGRRDYSRIKDVFRTNPKLIDAFLRGKFDIDQEYMTSKAKGARYARNMITSVAYVISNGTGFLTDMNVKLTASDISTLKRCKKVVDDVLKMVE